MQNKLSKQAGFTLIELLVIISIVAFLTAALLLGMQNSNARARDVKRVADIQQITNALNLFHSNCGAFPIETSAVSLDSTKALYLGTAAGCGNKIGEPSTNGGIGDIVAANGTILVQKFSNSPLPPGLGCTDDNTPTTSNRYLYSSDAIGSTYTLTFCLGTPVGNYTTAGLKTIRP